MTGKHTSPWVTSRFHFTGGVICKRGLGQETGITAGRGDVHMSQKGTHLCVCVCVFLKGGGGACV